MNHTRVAKLLLDNGADVNASTTAGQTVIYSACVHGNVRTIDLLLKRGANVGMAKYVKTKAVLDIAYDPVLLT